MVSDRRAPTPTAAGAMVAYNQYDLKRFFIDNVVSISHKINNKISYEYKKFINDINLMILKMNGLYENKKHKLIIYKNALIEKINKMYDNKNYILNKNINILEALNPMTILKKGYFKIKKDTKTIDNNTVIKIGDNIEINGYNKKILADVTDVLMEDKYEIR
jgi:exonuclease VII large subunit